tara:strand:+ start:636 stop:884 length:249 start_codon:yes stop_codon:yes gene_type:complete
MTGEVQIILLILSSIFGYLARMKIKAKCGCCELEIERDDNNKVKRVSVVKKEKSQRNLDTSSLDTISENTPRSKKNQQSGVL